MSEPFRYYLRVRYGECDAQKVVFNARYGDYVDLASLEFLRAIGYSAELVSGELDYQLVKQTMEWKSPARFDDVLQVSIQALRLGTTSFTLRFDFRIAGREPLVANCETVYVLVDQHTLAKRELPQDLRERLNQGAPDVSVDHAGYFRM